MQNSKKPRGYTAHVPFTIAFHGVHYLASLDCMRLYGVAWRDLEVLAVLQYVLQIKYRDKVGFTAIRDVVGKRRNLKRVLERLMAGELVARNEYRTDKFQYSLTKIGVEVLNFYQRRIYLRLRSFERGEKIKVKYKFYELEELSKLAWGKGVLYEYWQSHIL